MWPNLQESADLVTFSEEILNGKLLCNESRSELDEFYNLLDMNNLVKKVTCTNNQISTRDLTLTIQKTWTNDIDISYISSPFFTIFKSLYSNLKPQVIHYRNHANFDKCLLLNDLEKVTLTNFNFPNQDCKYLIGTFVNYAPLKTEIVSVQK